MNTFGQGFNFGFMTGMFNNTFGFNAFASFHMCNFFSNPLPTFFTPSYDFSNFYQYQTPMPMMNSSLFSYASTNFLTPQMSFCQNNLYTLPDFSSSWSLGGDRFIKNGGSKKGDGNSELEGLKGKHWSELTDSQLLQIYGNYTRDITKLSDISTPEKESAVVEKLNDYLADKGVLAGKGQAFVDAQKQHGISAAVLVGIVMNESGKGTSDLAKNKNNVGGVRIVGSTEFRTFDSVEACIAEMARFLKAGYVDNSGRPLTKLYQVNAKYCPTSDPTDDSGTNGLWAKNVDMYAGQVDKALA